MKTNTLFLAWQDPQDRRWLPVGRLSFDGSRYQFVYTQGAKESTNFRPFGRMKDLDVVYESDELFPLFANRLLAKKRPEYGKLLDWLNLREHEDDPMVLLAQTAGRRQTDSLEVFACPEQNEEGEYHVHFFHHGLSHLSTHVVQQVNDLKPGDRLLLMDDLQNPSHQQALALRTVSSPTIVGYCPRYLADDLHFLISECGPHCITASVERVNADAPLQLRLLCNITACWPPTFSPCSEEAYRPLATGVAASDRP